MIWNLLKKVIPEDEPCDGSTHWVTKCVNPYCSCSHKDWHKHYYIDGETGQGYCFRCQKGYSMEWYLSLKLEIPVSHAVYMTYGDRRNRRRNRITRKRSRKGSRSIYEVSLIPSVRLPKGGVCAAHHPYLLRRGIWPTLSREKGLRYYEEGQMRNRIVTPLRDHTKRLIGYSGRSVGMSSTKNLYPNDFPKAKIVYNSEALTEDWCVLVEGELGDAFSVMRVTPRVGALYGNRVHAEQAIRLHKQGIRLIYLFKDGKEDPIPDANRLFMLGFEVRIVECGYDEDPGDLTEEEIVNALLGAKEHKVSARRLTRRYR